MLFMMRCLALLLFLNALPSYANDEENNILYRMNDNLVASKHVGSLLSEYSISETNTLFDMENTADLTYSIEVMNVNGKLYAMSVTTDWDSPNAESEFATRKYQRLTNIKIKDGELISDQLKLYFFNFTAIPDDAGEDDFVTKAAIKSEDEEGATFYDLSINEREIIKPGKYPEVSLTRLGYNELHNKTPQELKLMRNEVMARYGYRFNNPELNAYFSKQPWYQPNARNDGIQISELEEDNISMIAVFENRLTKTHLEGYDWAKIFQLPGAGIPFTKESINKVYDNKGVFYHNAILVNDTCDDSHHFYYYDNEGYLNKVVEISYSGERTDTALFFYDDNKKIVQIRHDTNNDYRGKNHYEYSRNNNLIKIIEFDHNDEISYTAEYGDDNMTENNPR